MSRIESSSDPAGRFYPGGLGQLGQTPSPTSGSPPPPDSARARLVRAEAYSGLLALCALLGCGDGAATVASTSASSSASAPAVASASARAPASAAASSADPEPTDPVPWVGIPRTVEEVEKVIRPSGEAPYAGKTGTLKGRVTIKGDPPPKETWSFPPECAEAAATYGAAFRVGQGGALADALVTVSGYPGFVPARAPAQTVNIQGCAFDRSTIAIAFGQRIEVTNSDAKISYMPYLDPAPYRALMIAMPKGRPARIYAYQPAINYYLRDYLKRPFMAANVLVLKFATHDVTGLDGLYEIPGIPVGKVQVNGYLPRLEKTSTKELEIKEGDNVLDLELTYDAKTDMIKPVPLASEAIRDAAGVPPKSVAPH